MPVLFCFDKNDNYDWAVTFVAVSKEYFEANGCLDDQFREDSFEKEIPGVYNLMEACFEIDPEVVNTYEEALVYLESHGLVFSEELDKFINQ